MVRKAKVDVRKVTRCGSSLSINLTKALRKMGIKRGDKVYIKINKDTIIISKKKVNGNGKPEIIDDRVWRDFLATLVKLYGRKCIMDEKKIGEKLEEAIKTWIKKKTSIWEKPIIKL